MIKKPFFNQKTVAVTILSSLIGICIGILFSSKSTNLDFIVTAFVTLFAAYLGVKVAFELQIKKQKLEKTSDDVKAGNKVIFELIRTYNKFIAIHQLFIEPRKNEKLNHYLIPPIAGTDSQKLSIDYDSLTFLFKTKEANILNELSAFQQDVSSTIEVINQRSELHFTVIQPAIEKAEIEFGSKLNEDQFQSYIGSRHEKIAIISTAHMIDGVENIITSSQNYIKEIGEFLEGEYPDHKILKMEIRT